MVDLADKIRIQIMKKKIKEAISKVEEKTCSICLRYFQHINKKLNDYIVRHTNDSTAEVENEWRGGGSLISKREHVLEEDGNS